MSVATHDNLIYFTTFTSLLSYWKFNQINSNFIVGDNVLFTGYTQHVRYFGTLLIL